MEERVIGDTAVRVSLLGFGGAALGNLYAPVSPADAEAAVHSAWDAGVRFFDTAPSYGSGLSELRMGAALAAHPRADYTLATKVGYRLEPVEGDTGPNMFKATLPYRPTTDFSADAVKSSLEGSLERLGVDRIDIVWLHDPDEATSIRPGADPYATSHFAMAMGEAYPVLDALRRDGVIGALGVGINQWQMLEDFARAGDFDCFLLAGRYTLLEQGALASLLPLCERRGISVVIGAPFASGVLATGATAGARYNYARAPEDVLRRVRALEQLCGAHGVPLPAAALQFPLGHPAVASVIPGARSAAEAEANARYLSVPIRPALWDDLRANGLIDASAPLPLASGA
jgi:D-threo-aldose 1-dehydrogenase